MAGSILLGLLALLLFLLALPVILSVEYEGDFTAQVRYLFFKFQVYPLPEGKEEPAEKEAPKEPDKDKPEKPKRESPSPKEIFALGKELLDGLLPPIRWLLKTIVFYDVFFGMRVAGDDAAQTAISCGRYNAYAFGVCAALKNYFQLKRVKISIFPDFTQEEGEIRFRGKVRFIPLAALAAGVAILTSLLIKLLPLFLRQKKDKDGGQASEESTKQNKGGVTI